MSSIHPSQNPVWPRFSFIHRVIQVRVNRAAGFIIIVEGTDPGGGCMAKEATMQRPQYLRNQQGRYDKLS